MLELERPEVCGDFVQHLLLRLQCVDLGLVEEVDPLSCVTNVWPLLLHELLVGQAGDTALVPVRSRALRCLGFAAENVFGGGEVLLSGQVPLVACVQERVVPNSDDFIMDDRSTARVTSSLLTATGITRREVMLCVQQLRSAGELQSSLGRSLL